MSAEQQFKVQVGPVRLWAVQQHAGRGFVDVRVRGRRYVRLTVRVYRLDGEPRSSSFELATGPAR